MNKKKVVGLVLGIIIVTIFFFIQPSEALTVEALRFIGIFLAMIVFMICDTLPQHITVLLALCALVISKSVPVATALSFYGNTVVWFAVAIFAMAAAMAKTGVLKRLALNIMKVFPETYVGTVLAMSVAGLVIGPTMATGQAKMGIMSPLSCSLAEEMGYEAHSRPAAGLFSAAYVPAVVASCAFITGSTMYSFTGGYLGRTYSFGSWLSLTFVWMTVLFILNVVFCAIYYKPAEDSKPIPKGFIKKRASELGPMTGDEKFAAAVLIIALILWMTESAHGISNTIIAILAVIAFSAKGIFTVQDFSTKISWVTFTIMGGIMTITACLSSLGITDWLGGAMAPYFGWAGNIWGLVPVTCIVTFALRYVIISQNGLLAIVFALFGPLAMSNGIDPFVVVWCAYMGTMAWALPFNNTIYLGAQAATGGYIEHKDQVATNYAFYVYHIVGCLASIPLWKVMGLW